MSERSERTKQHGRLPGGDAVGAHRCPPPASRPMACHNRLAHR